MYAPSVHPSLPPVEPLKKQMDRLVRIHYDFDVPTDRDGPDYRPEANVGFHLDCFVCRYHLAAK